MNHEEKEKLYAEILELLNKYKTDDIEYINNINIFELENSFLYMVRFLAKKRGDDDELAFDFTVPMHYGKAIDWSRSVLRDWSGLVSKHKPPMSPTRFKRQMGDILKAGHDTEANHCEMDNLMCSVLRQLGYGEGVDIFLASDRWYA